MKKLFLLCILVIGFQASHAQNATLMPLVAGDTLTNADTLYKVITATAGYSALGIQPVVTKISGTVAGNVILQSSLNGVNYVNTDTLALTDAATNTKLFSKITTPFVYYRLQFITAGTQSYVPRIYYVLRKHD